MKEQHTSLTGGTHVVTALKQLSQLIILLTFHSNHGPISYSFRDRRIFQSKIAKFFHPLVFCDLAEGVF